MTVINSEEVDSATLPDLRVAATRAGDFGRLRPAVSVGEKPGGGLKREEWRHLRGPEGVMPKMQYYRGLNNCQDYFLGFLIAIFVYYNPKNPILLLRPLCYSVPGCCQSGVFSTKSQTDMSHPGPDVPLRLEVFSLFVEARKE